MHCSAILAVYNSEKTVVAAIDSLLSQSVPLEIIIVDDGSTDNTKTIIIRIIEAMNNSQIKLVEQKHGGTALARNLGARESSGDILLFVDADMVFDKDYVRDLVAPIIAGEAIGTYTIDERVANWDHSLARCWNYQEGWEDGKRFPAAVGLATDYRAILKSKFESVGGFDNIGYTDTWSLFNKLGVRPIATNAICYHKNPDGYTSIFRQASWSAKRPYKLGFIGTLVALVRTSLPISIVAGIIKSVVHQEPQFFLFKIVYDLGRFVGITHMLTTGKLSK